MPQADGAVLLGFSCHPLPGMDTPTTFEVITDNGTGVMDTENPAATISASGLRETDFEVLVVPENLPARFAARARRDGKVVLVKFTAAWCGKCLQQEYQVFNTPEVAQAIRDRGVVYVKGDVTRRDLPAARWMRDNGYGVRIPMTLIFPPAGAPLPPLRGELTKELLIRKLDEAGGKTAGDKPI